jgi:hypothetical protein
VWLRGWVFIRYRDACARFNTIGRIDDASDATTARVARLWLDKVAGPPGADLSLHPDTILVKLWSDHPAREREPAADRQHVIAQVTNSSPNVTARGVQARLSVQMPGEDEYTPLQVVALNDIPPGQFRLATFEWDLRGENVTRAGLLVDAWADGRATPTRGTTRPESRSASTTRTMARQPTAGARTPTASQLQRR